MTDAAPLLSYSHGNGVQSMAMMALVASGDLPRGPFLFANVGADSEHPDTLRYLEDWTRPFAAGNDIELVVLHKMRKGQPDTLRQSIDRGRRGIPVRRSAGGPPMARSCTTEFKIRVIGKELKARGATKDQPATVNIGISVDEIERAKPGTDDRSPWQVRAYPLLTLGLHRSDCRHVITAAGLPIPPKSACHFCPFHDVEAWRALKRETPDLFDDAVQMEAEMSAAATDGRPVFLTRYGVPLDQAITDHPQLPGLDGCDEGYCFT